MPMPQNLKPTWDAIYNEVVAVHARWIIFRQLFAQPQKTLDILNKSASAFFYVIQGTLLDDVQLTLSKLADPASTGGRLNATVQHITAEIKALQQDTINGQLATLEANYLVSCHQIKLRRNQQIAHYDRATLMAQYGHGNVTLPGPSREEIERALDGLRKFMNAVERFLFNEETAYEHFVSREDGESLIHVIEQGLRYEELVRQGVIPWDDLANSR